MYAIPPIPLVGMHVYVGATQLSTGTSTKDLPSKYFRVIMPSSFIGLSYPIKWRCILWGSNGWSMSASPRGIMVPSLVSAGALFSLGPKAKCVSKAYVLSYGCVIYP